MFARFFAVAALVAFVAATPLTLRNGQCNTGNIQCCESSSTTSEYNRSPLAKVAGLVPVVAGVEATLGLNCSPISALALSSNKCEQKPMCCSGNKYNGVVNIGCTPINIL